MADTELPDRATSAPRPGLGHPGAAAFCDELRGGEYDAALQRYSALPSGELREFYVAAAADTPMLDPEVHDAPHWAEQLMAVHGGAALSWTIMAATRRCAAWRVRGGGPVDLVPADVHATFFGLLRRSERDLRQAVRLDPADPVPWTELIISGYGLQIPLEERCRRHDRAVALAPDLYRAPGQLLQGLCTKWGGSDDLALQFARAVDDLSPAGSPNHRLVAEAHLERWVQRRCPANTYFDEDVVAEILAAAERCVLHPEFVDTVRHPAAAVARNTFAVCLFAAGLDELARQQATLLADRLSEWPWRYLGDPGERFDHVLKSATTTT